HVAEAKGEWIMRILKCSAMAVGFLVMTALAFADDKKRPAAAQPGVQNDLEKLQGTWSLASRERKGQKTPDEDVKNWKLTIKDDEWTVKYPGGTDKATIKLDPSKDPKTIDLMVEFRNAKVLERGIYRLASSSDGDILTLCRVDQRG